MLYYFLTYLINIFRIGRIELWIVSLYFSEIGKTVSRNQLFLHILSYHWNILHSTKLLQVAGGWCGHIRPRGLMTASWLRGARHIGTRDGDGPWPRILDAVSAVETILINIVTSQCIRRWVGTCILPPLKISWLLGRNYETDSRRK